jgi:hypothetical protein
MTDKPHNNIPVYDDSQFNWEYIDGVEYATAKLSNLVPHINGTWTGCMWHGQIWNNSFDEGFLLSNTGTSHKELYILDETWSTWDVDSPNVAPNSFRYLHASRSDQIIIKNDIGITIQKIDDVIQRGPISEAYEIHNYHAVFPDE